MKVARIIFEAFVAVALVGAILLLALNFVGGITIPEELDSLPLILLSAASLSLLTISFFIAVFGVFGWRSLKDYLSREVKAQVGQVRDEIERNSLASLRLTAGVFFGRHVVDGLPAGDPVAEDELAMLETAISCSESAMELFPDDSRNKWVAKNNLAFCLSYHPDRGEKNRALELAREVLDQVGDAAVVNTYAGVLINVIAGACELLESEEVPELLRDIELRLLELRQKRKTPVGEAKNAERHLKSLEKLKTAIQGESVEEKKRPVQSGPDAQKVTE